MNKNACCIHMNKWHVSYERTPVLWDISFDIPCSQLVAVIGPNGAGKSTLLKSMLGFIPVISGNVEFCGKSRKEFAQHIAYVPQKETVDWDFPITVFDLVLMGAYKRAGLFRWISRCEKRRAQECIEAVGLKGFENRQISQLSGGQQQRAFIARALLQEAEIYFMDEPFAGVDIATEKVIFQVLKKIQKQGKTVFVVHHDLHTVASYFDWAIILNVKLIASGPIEKVLTTQNLDLAYGRSLPLFDDVVKLIKQKNSALVT